MDIDEFVYGPGNGQLSIEDSITVQPFVDGIPHPTAQPTGSATWSGDFVGFETAETTMALLRADTSLRYALDTNDLAVGITEFENYYDRNWHTSNLADHHYNLLSVRLAGVLWTHWTTARIPVAQLAKS